MILNEYGVLDQELQDKSYAAGQAALAVVRPLLDEMSLPDVVVFLAHIQSSLTVECSSYTLRRQVAARRAKRAFHSAFRRDRPTRIEDLPDSYRLVTDSQEIEDELRKVAAPDLAGNYGLLLVREQGDYIEIAGCEGSVPLSEHLLDRVYYGRRLV